MLHSILAILDEGLRLYRRAFSTFAALAALGVMPMALGGGLLIWAAPSLGVTLTMLGVLGWLLAGLPLAIHTLAGLSRATLLVRAGERVHLLTAVALPPLRALGMGCYGTLVWMGANMLSSMVSCFVICPLYMALSFALSGVFIGAGNLGEGGAALGGLVAVFFVFIFLLIFLLSAVLNGATFSTMIYALQAFALDEGNLSAALKRSLDLLFFRLGRNLLAFLLASLIFSAIATAVTVAISVLLPLPLVLALGERSPITRSVSASAWLIGLTLALPPLPIWMALLYERNLAEREGYDLEERIEALQDNERWTVDGAQDRPYHLPPTIHQPYEER